MICGNYHLYQKVVVILYLSLGWSKLEIESANTIKRPTPSTKTDVSQNDPVFHKYPQKIWSPENWDCIFPEQNVILLFLFPLPFGLPLESETI